MLKVFSSLLDPLFPPFIKRIGGTLVNMKFLQWQKSCVSMNPLIQISWFENFIFSCIVATLTIYKSKKVTKSLWMGYRVAERQAWSKQAIQFTIILGACLKCKFMSSSPDLLNQNLSVRAQEFVLTNSWWFFCTGLNMNGSLNQLCLIIMEGWGYFLVPNPIGLNTTVYGI